MRCKRREDSLGPQLTDKLSMLNKVLFTEPFATVAAEKVGFKIAIFGMAVGFHT